MTVTRGRSKNWPDDPSSGGLPAALAIRDAAEADLPAIVAIYNEGVATRVATADTEPVTVEARRAWFHAHSPGRWPIWVAQADGKIAGWLSLQPFHERPAYRITGEVSVYVTASHRKRGIGRLLLKKAVQRAPALGLHNLVALVFGHNEPSLGLFEGLGFQRWGRLPRVADMFGAERDLVILGLRVDGP